YFHSCLRVLHSFPTRRSSDLFLFYINNNTYRFEKIIIELINFCCTSLNEENLKDTQKWKLIKCCVYCLFLVENVLQKEEKINLIDRKSTRLNSSHVKISYAVF